MSYNIHNSSESGNLSNNHNHSTVSIGEFTNLLVQDKYSVNYHPNGYAAVAPVGRTNGPDSRSSAHESSHLNNCSISSASNPNSYLCSD